MDVVDRVSLSCQGVDEHPCAGCHSRLGNLGNWYLLLGNSTGNQSFSGNLCNWAMWESWGDIMLSRTLCCDTCHRQVSINDVPRCDKPIPDITRYHTPSNLTRISPHAPRTQETEMLDSVSQYDPLGAQNKVPDTWIWYKASLVHHVKISQDQLRAQGGTR